MDYVGRIARTRAEMARQGIGILYLPFSSDAAWLTGLGFERPGPTVTNRPGDMVAGIYLDALHGPLVVAAQIGRPGYPCGRRQQALDSRGADPRRAGGLCRGVACRPA